MKPDFAGLFYAALTKSAAKNNSPPMQAVDKVTAVRQFAQNHAAFNGIGKTPCGGSPTQKQSTGLFLRPLLRF
ncbi:MAG TPA: hypothetical protein VN626_04970, partial [Clostridia bacterium]|nr:hypothetical protein [Clostridia bacterium]